MKLFTVTRDFKRVYEGVVFSTGEVALNDLNLASVRLYANIDSLIQDIGNDCKLVWV